MPWMDCVCAVALPNSCTRIQQRDSKPSKPYCSASGVGRGIRATGCRLSNRAVFLPCSQAELNTQRKEQFLFNLFLAKCPMNPKKEAVLDGKLLISRAHVQPSTVSYRQKNIKTKDFREPIPVLDSA